MAAKTARRRTAKAAGRRKGPKQVGALTHAEASRRNIPTAEMQTHAENMEEAAPKKPVSYPRNPDLDPQLVWRGKDEQNWSDLVVPVPPVYVQEKVHPKAIVDGLMKAAKQERAAAKEQRAAAKEEDGREEDTAEEEAPDLFADFNGIAPEERTEFYQHDQNWSNRMILGDSLYAMASLAEREGLRGKVQCIYFDPPYGIKFNSNWQVSTRSRDVKDSKKEHVTREPEQVKAFRDTWKDGIHSYLTYLRDRLTVMRDLLTESGSIFLQIGDENVHLVRAVMDEVFGEKNFISLISYAKTTGFSGSHLSSVADYIIWYAKEIDLLKFRPLYSIKQAGEEGASKYKPASTIEALKNSPLHSVTRLATSDQLTSQGASLNAEQEFLFKGKKWTPPAGLHWKTTVEGLGRLSKAERVIEEGKSIRYVRCMDDFPIVPLTNIWLDIGGVQSRTDPKVYVVQTATEAVKRCLLMTTDPGDLVLDPTCGSGTTALVAEQWGRRWITMDTSRVALALARARLMGARYPCYLLADSEEGRRKEREIIGKPLPDTPTRNDIRQGFVYERVPHVTLKSIANNAEIDDIWDRWQETLEPLRASLNTATGESREEWEIPREAESDWSAEARDLHGKWWQGRIARQKQIDASIASAADVELLYDRPYENKNRVRVSGPFTVESLSPHRVIPSDEDAPAAAPVRHHAFASTVLDALRASGVQQADKADRITFTDLQGWPGDGTIAATGAYAEGAAEKRAAIFIGPEFGSVTRAQLIGAAGQARKARFDLLIACGFNFDVHTSELAALDSLPILKAKMNPDLHMGGDLANTGAGNLFVIFGEPDVGWTQGADGRITVEVRGVDVFDAGRGAVRSGGTEDIAAWFIDTDYNEESFFVRHAYFLGAQDPYKSLKTSLKAEISADAWQALHRDRSRPFPPPEGGRFAVKVINHFGDEVMKVFSV